VSRKQLGNKAGASRSGGPSRFVNKGANGKGLRTGKNVDYNEDKSDNLVGSKRGVDGEIV
jgi:hypothetical protein